MSERTVSANEASLRGATSSLDEAANDFKSNFERLEGVVSQIGVDIKGVPADNFLNVYNGPIREKLTSIYKTLQEITEGMENKTTEFGRIMDEEAIPISHNS